MAEHDYRVLHEDTVGVSIGGFDLVDGPVAPGEDVHIGPPLVECEFSIDRLPVDMRELAVGQRRGRAAHQQMAAHGCPGAVEPATGIAGRPSLR